MLKNSATKIINKDDFRGSISIRRETNPGEC